MAAFGLTIADYPRPEVDLWPETVMAFDVFCRMVTQWRMGMAGPIGLDYSVLPFVMRMACVPRKQRKGVFEQVRIMEDAALATMNEG
ncbi:MULTISPECIES: DUF1799 domain-containing protein [Cupriavidus]|uniref:DUF1799 domain-containing protein n=1 Tax=Cupriavidus TaxID=106589 RepID=UPI002277234E|nr:DUF1799 domain-containing protein [Cupriavidus metallidurans]MDE4918155.1 DUF1799 domain-containing protein [Cupriavidus metallidurans]